MDEIENKTNEFIERYKDALDEAFTISNSIRSNQAPDIDYSLIPNGVKFSEVDQYLKKIDPEFTRRKFSSYIEQGLIPNPIKKNEKLSLYLKEHIIHYLFVNKYKEFIPLNRLKNYIDASEPALHILGWNNPFSPLQTEGDEESFKPLLDFFHSQFSEYIDEELEEEFDDYNESDRERMKEYLVTYLLSNELLKSGRAFLKMFDELIHQYLSEDKNPGSLRFFSEMADKFVKNQEKSKVEQLTQLEEQKNKIQVTISNLLHDLENTNDQERAKELQRWLNMQEQLLATIEVIKRSWN